MQRSLIYGILLILLTMPINSSIAEAIVDDVKTAAIDESAY